MFPEAETFGGETQGASKHRMRLSISRGLVFLDWAPLEIGRAYSGTNFRD